MVLYHCQDIVQRLEYRVSGLPVHTTSLYKHIIRVYHPTFLFQLFYSMLFIHVFIVICFYYIATCQFLKYILKLRKILTSFLIFFVSIVFGILTVFHCSIFTYFYYTNNHEHISTTKDQNSRLKTGSSPKWFTGAPSNDIKVLWIPT